MPRALPDPNSEIRDDFDAIDPDHNVEEAFDAFMCRQQEEAVEPKSLWTRVKGADSDDKLRIICEAIQDLDDAIEEVDAKCDAVERNCEDKDRSDEVRELESEIDVLKERVRRLRRAQKMSRPAETGVAKRAKLAKKTTATGSGQAE